MYSAMHSTSYSSLIRKWTLLTVITLLLTACDLDVSTTSGGRVISDPVGIDCRETNGQCEIQNYEKLGDGNDKIVTKLTAIPDAGFRLSHWSGDCDKTVRHQCHILMQDDLAVKAHFVAVEAAQDEASNEKVRFVAVGDMGEGNHAQFLVAEAMKEVCQQAGGCQFAVGLGDNIYDDQPGDAWHEAFETKFELPYRNLDFPFYMSLGNHDNDILIDGTGGSNMAGDIQVDYSYRQNRMSEKWKMPSRYYHFSALLTANQPLIDFFALDSNPMNSAPDINSDYRIDAYKKEQAQWFNNTLAQSRATWKIAYTHHPYISNGRHGNAGNYDGAPALGPLSNRLVGKIYQAWFEDTICGKVDVFFAGHDHDLQLLHSVPECGKTLFVVSGAAAKSRELKDKNRNVAYWQKGEQTGFFFTEISGNTMIIKAYEVDSPSGKYRLAHEQVFPRRTDF
ncbi:MAG: tartrate-resistant acid phosphatase type 5 [Moritella sp.]|jgi:tartrate-resistant acid phosphatase type 5